jgi:hypothetical protein
MDQAYNDDRYKSCQFEHLCILMLLVLHLPTMPQPSPLC